MTLRVDIETFSSYELKKVGVYRYVEAPDFAVMLFGYKRPGQPTVVLDWSGLERWELQAYVADALKIGSEMAAARHRDVAAVFPADVLRDLLDNSKAKHAFNANFERTCLAKFLGVPMPPEAWRCTMVHALYCGLPGDLARVGLVLKAKIQKKEGGAALITYFCKPCKPTKRNGGRTRNLPHHDPAKWSQFVTYCGVDVDSEEAIALRLVKIPLPAQEQRAWELDQRINDRGVAVDRRMAAGAVAIDNVVKTRLLKEAAEITGLSNPNSMEQLKGWLNSEVFDELGMPITSLDKKALPGILLHVESGSIVDRVLEIRRMTSKSSVSKYLAALTALCADGRLRGMLQFYGANRTGRWAARLVQIHNLVKNDYSLVPDFDVVREIISQGDADMLELLFGDALLALSQCVRCMFIAPQAKLPVQRTEAQLEWIDDCVFPPSPRATRVLGPVDFSAIEARALAWKAKEEWRLEVFRTHGRIYEASASTMFGIPLDKIKKGSPERQKGKVAELALGYGGGEGALVQMGALEMGLTLEELDPLKHAWRAANRKITKLWWDVGDAAMACVKTGRRTEAHGISFRIHARVLCMRLDSGRELCYIRPMIEEGKYGDNITYEGMDQVTKQWTRIFTYGPKLIENWDQAFCRDLLLEKMLAMEEAGLGDLIAFHVHDEVVPEVEIGSNTLGKIERIFAAPVRWAPGMPLRGDGYLTPFYVKEND